IIQKKFISSLTVILSSIRFLNVSNKKISNLISPIFELFKAHLSSKKMLKRLQQKWKVGRFQFVVIIICFALAGRATGYIGGDIMDIFSKESWLWIIIYLIIIALTWPLAV